MRIPLFRVDAFTDRPFAGNPAAVCPLSGWLDDRTLVKVAAENNLSATAFLVPQEDRLELRWFTPLCEVRLCGHATLAAGHVVLNILQTAIDSIAFESRFSGVLTVRKRGKSLSMDFPAMFAKTCTTRPDGLVRALGPGPEPSEVLEVNDTYIAVYESKDAICNLRPDCAELNRLHPFAVAVTAPGDDVDFVSRYFAPSYGVFEDPVTGSVHCSLTPYWAHRLGKTHLHARQVSERGGELWCETNGDRVLLKGNAVLTLKGSLSL